MSRATKSLTLTKPERFHIGQVIHHRRHSAETAEQWAQICWLQTLLLNGPWYNGQTQVSAIEQYRDDVQKGLWKV